MKQWILNCDMGEKAGNDHLIMPYIQSCSIACGGHVGDADSMNATIHLAMKYQVEIGAHPSFPDKENFGRKPMSISSGVLIDSLSAQINSLRKVCSMVGAKLRHIKPHGALYHQASTDLRTAGVILEVMKRYPGTTLFAPYQSIVAELAQEDGIPVRFEGFADRKYEYDGSLAPRSNSNSVIKRPEDALSQVQQITKYHKLTSIDGYTFDYDAETFCIHGDNPNAVAIAKLLCEQS